MAVRRAEPRSSRCSWPTNSPSDAGRMRAGRGWSDAGTPVRPRRASSTSKSRSTARFSQPDETDPDEEESVSDATHPVVLGPSEGRLVQIGALGVRFMIGADESGGGFSLVEHPIAPRSLAAPVHTHTHEDEYSYVLEGQVGVQVGDEVKVGRPGDLIFK